MANAPLRVVFAGTPPFAARHLAKLLDSDHRVLAVYTQPDRPAGRGRKLQASPVKQLAQQHGIPVYQHASLKGLGAQQELAALKADVMVVVAYGLLLPQAVLDIPRLGCINVHASLLPRWRGAAPVQRAIEHGDAVTGVTIMQMDAGLDTGRMLASEPCPIEDRASAGELLERLALLGPDALLKVLEELASRQRDAQAQDEAQACYAHKISKSEALIDWTRSAVELDRRVRAFNPFPVCYTKLGGQRIKVWTARPLASRAIASPPGTILRTGDDGIEVCCGLGVLALQTLQLEGGKALAVEQLLHAHQSLFAVGARFDALTTDET